MFCTKCGHAYRDASRFCAQCGTALPSLAANTADAPPATSVHAETSAAGHDAARALPSAANSNRRNAIVLGSVVLLCALATAAVWTLTRNATPPASAPMSEARTSTQADSASESTPLAPDALPPAPGMPVQAAVQRPVVLSEAEVRQVLARLQQEAPPLSCQEVAQRIRADYNTGPVQADDIARRAYPQLCAPSSAALATTSAYPENGSIDQLYEQRAAAECAKGLTGLLCREILHNKLCSGRWSANPPPGQSRCLRADSADHN